MVKINGEIEVYDLERFRDWLFIQLQEQEFIGTFDLEIETNK